MLQVQDWDADIILVIHILSSFSLQLDNFIFAFQR
jgi:hypothetical protein